MAALGHREALDNLTHILLPGVGGEVAVADGSIAGGPEVRQAVDVFAVEQSLEAKLFPKLRLRRSVDAADQPVVGHPELVDHAAAQRCGPVHDPGPGPGKAGGGVASACRKREIPWLEAVEIQVAEADKDRVVRGCTPVKATVDLVVVPIARRVEQVVLPAAPIRLRIEPDDPRRYRVDAVCGQDVILEPSPRPVVSLRGWIIDLSYSREVATYLLGRWDDAEPRQLLPDPRALVTAEIEHPVLDERAAEGRSVLVLPERGLRAPAVEEVVGIEHLVAEKLERRPVDVVGSGLCCHLDDGATSAAELRAVVVGFHLEFLDGVDRGLHRLVGSHHDAAEVVVVVRAVECEHVLVESRAVNAEGVLDEVLPTAREDSGCQNREFLVVPAV